MWIQMGGGGGMCGMWSWIIVCVYVCVCVCAGVYLRKYLLCNSKLKMWYECIIHIVYVLAYVSEFYHFSLTLEVYSLFSNYVIV